jgi:exodeoxyribonuclease III
MEWNCCGGFNTVLPVVLDVGCDLAVLCEVAEQPPPPTLLGPAIDWHWEGQYQSKGLAVAAFGGAPLDRIDRREGSGLFSIAAEASSGYGVLGIWTCPPRGTTYGLQATSTIAAHADWLRSRPSIVAGDFNLAPFGSEDRRTGVLRTLFADLERLGYRSGYHHFFQEEYGSETRPTYFHRRKPDAPFHIDFCFLHESLLPQIRAIEVGGFERWVARPSEMVTGHSDHVPIVLDLDI